MNDKFSLHFARYSEHLVMMNLDIVLKLTEQNSEIRCFHFSNIGVNILRVILELFRITAIFLIFGAVLGGIVKLIYASLGINVDNTNGAWLIGLSILILLYVLYRNKLQFSGFYKGKGKVKLPKKVGISLISCSVLMLIIAPILH